MPGSAKSTVTVSIENQKRAELDQVARIVSRDRSYVINEAIDAYLALHRWQLSHISEGLRQADAGEFASDDEISAVYAQWR